MGNGIIFLYVKNKTFERLVEGENWGQLLSVFFIAQNVILYKKKNLSLNDIQNNLDSPTFQISFSLLP